MWLHRGAGIRGAEVMHAIEDELRTVLDHLAVREKELRRAIAALEVQIEPLRKELEHFKQLANLLSEAHRRVTDALQELHAPGTTKIPF